MSGAFTHVPLLPIQAELYALPKGRARFREYLQEMTGGGDDLELPLTLMNPMAKPHAQECLAKGTALGAEERAAEWVSARAEQLPAPERDYRVGIVLVDDAKGGWTERFATEWQHLFGNRAETKRGWTTVLIWTSEEVDLDRLSIEIAAALYRTLDRERFGEPATLGEMMRQEGAASRFAGRVHTLSTEELATAAETIAPHTESGDYPTCLAALFGDEAAEAGGHLPLGLVARAGLAVALAQSPPDPHALLAQ